ncbi:MAG: hypothetical protein JKY67_12875 [Pseudomonadales bacterium]|nr:hypothetical protein [Pseudomonadales bacterium]
MNVKKVVAGVGTVVAAVIGFLIFGGIIIPALPFLVMAIGFTSLDDFLKEHIEYQDIRTKISWLVLGPNMIWALLAIFFSLTFKSQVIAFKRCSLLLALRLE